MEEDVTIIIMVIIIVKIFFIAFLINLFYELVHSVWYETCLKMSLKTYVLRIIRAALFDGCWITGCYFVLYLIFQNVNPFQNTFQIIIFSVTGILFAYFMELYAINKGLWEYSEKMPLILGVGLTPLIQLFLTGLLTFYLIFVF